MKLDLITPKNYNQEHVYMALLVGIIQRLALANSGEWLTFTPDNWGDISAGLLPEDEMDGILSELDSIGVLVVFRRRMEYMIKLGARAWVDYVDQIDGRAEG